MAKQIGADRLGDFYTNGRVRKRREWRGLADTMYDYSCWLKIMLILGKFLMCPRNIKAMFRYRWMANYLAVPMMVDRHTQGLRGEYLRIAHTEFDLVVDDVAKLLTVLNRLCENGNTVLVIEHNLDVIKTADYVIDLGPEGGDGGGTVIAQGTPEEVISHPKEARTIDFLNKVL